MAVMELKEDRNVLFKIRANGCNGVEGRHLVTGYIALGLNAIYFFILMVLINVNTLKSTQLQLINLYSTCYNQAMAFLNHFTPLVHHYLHH